MRIRLEDFSRRREAEFLRAVRASRALHRGFVAPPATSEAYREFLQVLKRDDQVAFLVVLKGAGELAGVVTIDDIVRGSYQFANLGYYAFVPHAGKGYMHEALRLAVRYCFRELKLHRIEASIQPANARSVALVKGLGFRQEGVTRHYLKLGGRWRDHERWALLADEWRPRQVA